MNKLIKDQQIEDIEKTIAELSKQVEELKKPEEEKFKFCGDGYAVYMDGEHSNEASGEYWRKESERGRVFPTEALAVKYDKLITNSYKIAQAVAQLAPDYEPDWSTLTSVKYNLVIDIPSNRWYLDYWNNVNVAGVVNFPESIKDKMLELANSGALGLEV